MLEFQNLTIRRDNRTILDQLHMEIAPGTVLGLVGPDADAKMTILRASAGIAFPSEGDILLDGDSVFDKKSGAWMRYGYLSRDHVLFHQLKLFEYYEMYLSLYKIRGRIARIRIEDLIEELALEKYTDLYLEELPLEAYRERSELIGEDVFAAIDLAACVEKRQSEGGTCRASVEAQIAYVKEALQA